MSRKKRNSERPARACATADPQLVVRVIDSGAEEWAQITEAMAKYVPNGREANVAKRFGKLTTASPRKPSVASLLASRQIQHQLREASR